MNNFEKKIYDEVIRYNMTDGVYKEKYLVNDVMFRNEDGEYVQVVRVLNVDDNVCAHILNSKDETTIVNFSELNKDTQIEVYADIMGCHVYDIDEFFDNLKGCLDDGDKLCVSYEEDENGETDYDNLVYSIYNSCNDVIGEYHAKTGLYKSY